METFNFNINIGQKVVAFFGAIFVLIFLVGLSIAFGGSDPATVGHTAGELQVNTSDGVMTLQQAINNGSFGGGIFTEKSISPALPLPEGSIPTIWAHGLSGEPITVFVFLENVVAQAGWSPGERIILSYNIDIGEVDVGPSAQVSFNATDVHVVVNSINLRIFGKGNTFTTTNQANWELYIMAYR